MSKPALVVIDFQNDYFENGAFPLWNTDTVLENTVAAIAHARASNTPVILIQHIAAAPPGQAPFFNEGSTGAEIHPRILAAAGDAPVVRKAYADSFHQTTFAATLSSLGVDTLLLCGMMTQNCVTHTALSKQAEAYTVKIVADACTTVTPMIHRLALGALAVRLPSVQSNALL